MQFRLGELFCGPGGLGLGASQASVENNGKKYSIKHIWANDSDKDSCNTYKQNIDTVSVIRRDIRKVNFSELADIDALGFGFPCNDFSLVGEQKGMDGVYGPLYSYGIKALKHFKPKWFFAENVSGLISANDGHAFQTILEEMQGAGYTITPHLYRFEEYGVPQARHRIIIIGVRSDLPVKFKVPAPYSTPFLTSRQALEEPPISLTALNNERTKHSKQVIERFH